MVELVVNAEQARLLAEAQESVEIVDSQPARKSFGWLEADASNRPDRTPRQRRRERRTAAALGK